MDKILELVEVFANHIKFSVANENTYKSMFKGVVAIVLFGLLAYQYFLNQFMPLDIEAHRLLFAYVEQNQLNVTDINEVTCKLDSIGYKDCMLGKHQAEVFGKSFLAFQSCFEVVWFWLKFCGMFMVVSFIWHPFVYGKKA
ncbi:hypothetical protein V8073_004684 [Vibrio parahaemolyticus]|nr:hypothetical protein [Vibrio vulnificus]HCG5516694.1 hypothetical protein [Vibrio parahaemolyticus]